METPDVETCSTPLARLDRARQELTNAAASGQGGRAALARFSDRVDGIIAQLFDQAPRPSCPVVVMALGGYGRRQLSLHSDIDVLLAFDGSIGPGDEQFLRGFLHPLWDLHLVVGHHVRELDEFAALDGSNPEFLLALVDGRPIAGDLSLAVRIMRALEEARVRAEILRSLSQLTETRHAGFNDTLYQLEPDVKDAPGALRDLWATRTMLQLTDPGLLDRGPVDRVRLDEAEDFLFRIRSILHVTAKRNHNSLSHELQEKAARALRYEGAETAQQVEHLMSDYFRHARGVSRALEWARRSAPTPVGPNLVRSRDGIRFVDAALAASSPVSWLGVFQAAIDTSSEVADETLALIQEHLDRYAAEDFFPTDAARAALLAFLRPRPGLYARLSEMHDCGLLGRMFPEFAAVSCRVIRDFYHKYTVDEHTLLTIRSLERLIAPSTPSRDRFGALLADLAAPELLVLSLLYHDVGKWRDEDHVVESARMAKEMLARLRMPPASAAMVEFLIRNHLQMSLAAFRRDTEDPEIIRRFADVVGIEEQLQMLCLLTLADVDAVSPDTMTPWREELLWRLYVDTYNHLTLGYADDVIDRSQSGLSELLSGRPPHLSESEVRRFVEGLPRRYLRLFAPETVYEHVQLSRDIKADEVHATLQSKGSAWELTVVTLDKPFLFSNICGTLSLYGMDILRGHAMTNPNGLVLDTFQFTDTERFLELNADGRELVLQKLASAVSGGFDVSARLRAREQSVFHRGKGARRFPPVIHSDNHSSRRYTILDIIAGNAVGLLHRISRVISRHDCDIDLVLIATEGERAIDVFHITTRGAKVDDAALATLTGDLQRMLEGHDEID